MPVYRVTFGLQQATYGASETYYTQSMSPADAGVAITRLARKRNNLLFDTTNWVGIRISEAGGVRRSALYPPGIYTMINSGFDLTVPERGAISSTPVTRRSDQARSCLQVRVGFGIPTRNVIKYLSFVPDAIVGDEPASANLARDVGWSDAFNVWQQEFATNLWQVQAQMIGGGFAKKDIRGWIQSAAAPSVLGVVIDAADVLTVGKGGVVRVENVRRKGTDRLSYNGKYIVADINTTLIPGSYIYYLRGTEAGDPDSIKRLGTIRAIAYNFEAITRYASLRGGVHKRGRPFVTPRGRSKTRASLDF